MIIRNNVYSVPTARGSEEITFDGVTVPPDMLSGGCYYKDILSAKEKKALHNNAGLEVLRIITVRTTCPNRQSKEGCIPNGMHKRGWYAVSTGRASLRDAKKN